MWLLVSWDAFSLVDMNSELEVKQAVDLLWKYLQMNQDLQAADMIWALGSHDLRVADRVAELWHQGLAPIVVMSGGLGNFTEGVFEKSEAELFADRAVELGVPSRVIFLECKSTNSGENVAFTRALIEQEALSVKSAIAVQKPYMERRAYATIAKQWEEVELQVTSPQLSFEEYCNEEIPNEKVIHIMVGDMQRIVEYPKRGFMIEQEVPEEVMTAWQLLVDAGYVDHVL